MSVEEVSADWEELSNEYKKLEVCTLSLFYQIHIIIKTKYNVTCASTVYYFHFNLKFQQQDVNTEYLELLDSLDRLQQRCLKDISHQRYRISQINTNLKK